MTTDTSERGLEALICTALAGHPCDPSLPGTLAEPAAGYGGVGWSSGNYRHYGREYCVDLVQLAAFRNARQNSDRENARIEHDRALQRVMTSIMRDDTELFRQFMDNEGFKRWLTDTVFELTSEQPRAA